MRDIYNYFKCYHRKHLG